MKLKKLIDDEPDSGGSNIKEDAAVDEHERWRGRLFF